MENNFKNNREKKTKTGHKLEIVNRILSLCFFGYILLIIKMIIFKYSFTYMLNTLDNWKPDQILQGIQTANFIPFTTIKMYIKYYPKLNSFENLFGNILVFIPFGVLFPLVSRIGRKWYLFLLVSLAFILGIEVFQLFTGCGAFDVDDIILNCLGALTGFLIFQVFSIIKRKLKAWREKH